jgi:hypothetical protein
VRRDADLQYALHQPDYFQKLELKAAPAIGFTAPPTGAKTIISSTMSKPDCLPATVFKVDNSSPDVATVLFEDYKNFGGPMVATKTTSRTGKSVRTFTYTSVTYQPLSDAVFELQEPVKALLK